MQCRIGGTEFALLIWFGIREGEMARSELTVRTGYIGTPIALSINADSSLSVLSRQFEMRSHSVHK